MNREALSEWLERIIAFLFIALALAGPLMLGAVRGTEFVVLQWLGVAILALWLVRLWLAPRPRLLLPPTCWAVLPFLILAGWRYYTADVEYAARQEFILILLLAVLFFAFVNNMYRQEPTRWFMAAVITLATLLSMYAVYQWITGSQSVWGFTRPSYQGRGSGTYISPNHFAGFLGMVLPTAIALVVASRFKALSRILLAYAALVITVGIASSGSRAGWVACGGATLLLAVALLRSRKQWWAALGIVLTISVLGMWLYPRVIKPRMQTPNPKFDDIRFRIWSSSWAMFQDHQLLGVGPNHFDIRYPGYRKAQWEMFMRPGHVHNDYLNTLVDWGILGLSLILLPIGVAAYGVASSWRFLRRSGGDFSEKGGNRVAYVLGAAVGLVAIMIHSLFDFNMHIPANAVMATLLLAILTTHWRYATNQHWYGAGWLVKIVLSILLLAAAGYLGWTGLTKTREAYALRAADRLPEASADKIAALKKAFEADPRNFETAFAIGERLRANAWLGEPGWEKTTREAIEWFDRAITLNRWDVQSHLRKGMCLDWLEEHLAAARWFERAIELDPNHYYVRAMMGWHYFHSGNYKEAITWCNRSLELNNSRNNTVAYTFRDLASKQLTNPSRNVLP